jgi:hypothetical protein
MTRCVKADLMLGGKPDAGSEQMDARLRMGKSGDEILNDPFQILNRFCDFA